MRLFFSRHLICSLCSPVEWFYFCQPRYHGNQCLVDIDMLMVRLPTCIDGLLIRMCIACGEKFGHREADTFLLRRYHGSHGLVDIHMLMI